MELAYTVNIHPCGSNIYIRRELINERYGTSIKLVLCSLCFSDKDVVDEVQDINPGRETRPSQVDDGFESLNGNGSSDNNEEEVNKSGEETKGEEGVLLEGVLSNSHTPTLSAPFICSSSDPLVYAGILTFHQPLNFAIYVILIFSTVNFV